MKTLNFREYRRKVEGRIPPGLFCWLKNAANRTSGYKHRIHPTESDNVLLISDEAQSIFICRRRRHSRYKRGVLARVHRLATEYHLSAIEHRLQGGGVLIDCGANVGELGIWARSAALRYIPFEPEMLEARCCDLNNFNGSPKTINKALWHENATLEFFRKPDSGDSSLIEMNQYVGVKRVEAVRLDNVLHHSELTGTVILKVEAEGAEPEVLAGATNVLPSIDYVAVDCGPERGKEAKPTFVETNSFLIERGFKLEYVNFERLTMLFRNMTKMAA